MAYLLYGAYGSGSSIIEATLSELGVEYEWNRVDAAKDAQREAPYTAVNPHRKLPTLITPAGETLTESAAIVLTLLERHPNEAVFPSAGSPERAVALRWMVFAVAELYPVVEIMDYSDRFSPNESATPGVNEKAHEIWRSRWQTVEGELGDGPYLLGDRFCASDIFLAALSRWDLPKPWRTANLPKLERLAIAVAARPRLQEIWPRNFPNAAD